MSSELENDDQSNNDIISDAPLLDALDFPNRHVRNEPTDRDIKFSDGITVKNIPNEVELKSIYEFLFRKWSSSKSWN